MKKDLFGNGNPLGKVIYAFVSLLLVAFGTACGLAGTASAGISSMWDASGYTEKELEHVGQWVGKFPGPHTQAEFVSKGITAVIILAILMLVALALLCVMSGRFKRDEEGKPVLNWFDRIWSEIHLIILACSATGAVCICIPLVELMTVDNHFGFVDLNSIYTPVATDEYYFGIPNDTILWYCIIGMALCIWITAVCLVTVVKKIKAGEMINKSLLGRILEILGRGAKQTGESAKKAGAGLRRIAGSARRLSIPSDDDRRAAIKLIMKYCVILLALIVIPEFLGVLLRDGFTAVIAEIAAVIIAVIFVIRKVGKLADLRAGIIEVRSGNLAYKIPVDEDGSGPKTDIDRMASDINHISEATNAAVQNEIKNQRLKTDLISNVSHDLKTPLTSMISYLDILEKEGLDSKDAPAHLDIVREKTERLKTLTEELFEAAKASSGNIPCEIESIDLSALIDQSLAEMGDRLSRKDLDIHKNIRTDKSLVLADGKLLYRVLENLLGNISKYALEGSRVYIDVSKPEAHYAGSVDVQDKLLLEVKNISRDELNISPDELMERFTRGDQSRNTEGSGLGLAIAKDLTTLMGGSFDITIDGDMFKASLLLSEAA